jgi:hypothetical protein
MLIKQTFTENYRTMTFKWTAEEANAVAFAIRRELDRLDTYLKTHKQYPFRGHDIANAKMLKSTLMDLWDHTIKP